jgi:hypothetical protein
MESLSTGSPKKQKIKELKKIINTCEKQIVFLELRMQSAEVTEECEKELYLQRIKNMKHAIDLLTEEIIEEKRKAIWRTN